MTEKKGIRGYITTLVMFFLAFDGILHLVEVVSAFYEEAWLTFSLTLFHATIFYWRRILSDMTTSTIHTEMNRILQTITTMQVMSSSLPPLLR